MRILESYELLVNDILYDIIIGLDKGEPHYFITITNITSTTKVVLEKIREEFIQSEAQETGKDFSLYTQKNIRDEFRKNIADLIKKYFPNADKKTIDMLVNYVLQQNIGFGNIEILLKDTNLEEIVVNNAREPIYVYHRKYGWLKTNITIPTEGRIRHFATMIGRDVGKEITVLMPLMDAHLTGGDRVNATLSPISSKGNTITIRKFSVKPWTITDLLKSKSISYEAAALIWLAVQNELSVLITGGTASGKTSLLNAISNCFPSNQRIISIEDTREIQLPKNLHWVPMETRLPNPEGKGGISMLDLTVNSLRMRPDRIVVGEIRRKREAEVLFEAMRTGHSVYGTLHANNVRETVTRLTSPPIELPKSILSALSLIVVQNLNRRTGKRRVLQIAEIMHDGSPSELMIYDNKLKSLVVVNKPVAIIETLNLYTGLSIEELQSDINEKIHLLRWMVKKNINDVNKIGQIMSNYYSKYRMKQHHKR